MNSFVEKRKDVPSPDTGMRHAGRENGPEVPSPSGCGKVGGGDATSRPPSRSTRSGPFTLWRCGGEETVYLSFRRHVLLFCLDGSVRLDFHSFSFTLTAESVSVAAVDGRRLKECRCTAGTELLEYRPRDGRARNYAPENESPAFTAVPVRGSLVDWARRTASGIEGGARLEHYDFCSVAVQLRDRSGGRIPYPFSCAEGCPAWGRCAAAGGYACAVPPARKKCEKLLPTAAALMGTALWGGLLLYVLFRDVIKLAEY